MSDHKLPTDPYDQQLERLTGLPGGAHTQPTVVQTTDFYGNATSWMLQVVKTDEGEHGFVTRVDATGAQRIVLPARVLQTLDRQRETVRTKVRRRHGRRLAAERAARGEAPAFLARKARAK